MIRLFLRTTLYAVVIYVIAVFVFPSYQRPLEFAKNLPPINSIAPIANPKYESVVHLTIKGNFICTGIVFDEQYVVTAAHCLDDEFGETSKEKYKILDPKHNGKFVVGKVAGVNRRMDYGIIKGDFKNFKKSPLNVYTNEFMGGAYIACGYPFGQKKLSCMPIFPQYNYVFQIAALGILYPGMSGGPVYNTVTGNVIGVNSAAADGFVIVSPLIGLYGSFGIEK
jgi:S1-C subfamily serine protease